MASIPAPNSKDVVLKHYQKIKKPQTERHRISNVNETKKFGICSICGPVKVVKRDNRYWRCSIPQNERSKLYKRAYRQSKKNMLVSQCQICGTTEKLCWDHNHVTEIFRGTLCSSCNLGLGLFKDSPELLKKAIKYLNVS